MSSNFFCDKKADLFTKDIGTLRVWSSKNAVFVKGIFVVLPKPGLSTRLLQMQSSYVPLFLFSLSLPLFSSSSLHVSGCS